MAIAKRLGFKDAVVPENCELPPRKNYLCPPISMDLYETENKKRKRRETESWKGRIERGKEENKIDRTMPKKRVWTWDQRKPKKKWEAKNSLLIFLDCGIPTNSIQQNIIQIAKNITNIYLIMNLGLLITLTLFNINKMLIWLHLIGQDHFLKFQLFKVLRVCYVIFNKGLLEPLPSLPSCS